MPQVRRALASVAHFRPNRRNLPLALIIAMAVLGTAHILVRTSTYGAAITRDSVTYLSAAESLAAGTGLTIFDGEPFLDFAPFFPMLLAFIDTAGIETRESVRWVNAVIFGLTILASGFWLLRTLTSQALALAATALVLVSPSLNSLASQAMSEPLFVLLVILALMQLGAFRGEETGRKPLLLAAVFTALAALTRYPGIALIFTGVAVLLLRPAAPFPARLRYAAVFGGIAFVPVAAALLRRWLIGATLEPLDGAIGQSSPALLRQVAMVVREWGVPDAMPAWSANLWIAAIALLLAGMGAMLLRLLFRHRTAFPSPRNMPFTLFILIYLIFMVVAVPRWSSQPIDDRYLLPLYIPSVVVGAFLMNNFFSSDLLQRTFLPKSVPVIIVVIIVFASIGFSSHKNIITTVDAREFGYFERSYNTAYWENSETIGYLKMIPSNNLIVSSQIPALWWEKPEGWYLWIEDIEHIVRTVENREGDVYIVSFFAIHTHYTPFIHFLNNVDIIFDGADGNIIRIPPGWKFDAQQFSVNLRQFLDTIDATSSAILSEFRIYIVDNTIVYTKQPCEPQDTVGWFFLHITPKNATDLPAYRQDYGFDNLDFRGERNDIFIDDQCVVSVPVPRYAIASIRTGQYIPAGGGELWSVEFPYPTN